MKIIRDNHTIQIEITSFCPKNCSNCTRFCSHYQKPWFMDFGQFKDAVDSLVDFHGYQGIGIMGGEPTFHPRFEEFCKYLNSKIEPERCGLWSLFPEEKKHYGPLIADTFGTVFLNDHSREDVIHAPFLISIEEILKPEEMWYRIENCWAWRSWSASINPHGAYFCELAASMAALFNDPETAWRVEPGWWLRVPKDYAAQMNKWCPKCGGALCGPISAWGRPSTDIIDDISPMMLERLKRIRSPKIKRGEYAVYDCKAVPVPESRQMATYKDEPYRQVIARRYGLFLMLNQKGFMTPYHKIVGTM